MPEGPQKLESPWLGDRRDSSCLGQQPQPALPALPFRRCSSSCSIVLPSLVFSALLPSPCFFLFTRPLLLVSSSHWCPTFAGQPLFSRASPGLAIGACGPGSAGSYLGHGGCDTGCPAGSFSPFDAWPGWKPLFLLCGEDFLASHVTVCHTSKGATDASCGWDVQRTVTHPFKGLEQKLRQGS